MRTKSGYIALISVIIISAIISVTILETSQSSFYNRFNILRSQQKEESLFMAKDCLQFVLVEFARNPEYALVGNNWADLSLCRIVSISPNSAGYQVITQGEVNKAVTVLQSQINIDTNHIYIQSAREI